MISLVILLKLDSHHWFFSPYDLEIRWKTSKNNRAPLSGYIKIRALFQSHQWIKTGFTVRKCSIQVKISDILSHMTLKFDGQPWKKGKSEGFDSCDWPSNLAQIGSKSYFLAGVTLDGWPWKPIGNLFYPTPSFVHHFIAIDEFKLELQSGNAQFGSKLAIFCPLWPWNLRDDLDK